MIATRCTWQALIVMREGHLSVHTVKQGTGLGLTSTLCILSFWCPYKPVGLEWLIGTLSVGHKTSDKHQHVFRSPFRDARPHDWLVGAAAQYAEEGFEEQYRSAFGGEGKV